MEVSADIAIIGSGIACSATLTELCRHLLLPGNWRKINVVVIEKYHELWKGIPYGSRSSVNSLTITSIHDFFTADEERAKFFTWFDPQKQILFEVYRQLGGSTAAQWLQENASAIDEQDWEKVYLPRFIIGKYIDYTLHEALKEATDQNLLDLQTIYGEATDVSGKKGDFNIRVIKPDDTETIIKAGKLVVAVGSLPERRLTEKFDKHEAVTYFQNVYTPDIQSNLKWIKALLSKVETAEERNILIVGSNASCIELLYLIGTDPNVEQTINKIVLLSSSGLLPYHISNIDNEEPCINLEALQQNAAYTFRELVAAAAKDIKATPEGAVCIPYIDRVVGLTLKMLQPLGDEAKKEFYGVHGVQLARLFRRSGADYKRGAGILLDDEKLDLLKGDFISVEDDGNNALLTYRNPETGTEQQFPLPFRIVINCTGSDDLEQADSKLIQSLVIHHHCKPNLSRKAFEVNEQFEAAPGIHIMGPLIGGNMNRLIHFWHLENASRILSLAPYLAKELLKE